MARDRAWTRPGEEVTINCPILKGKRFSLIGIIGMDGLARWSVIEGTYRKYEYLEFIKKFFQKINERDTENLKQGILRDEAQERILILDNCAIHDKEQTRVLARDCDFDVMYLPPYSPQLNPIENWFH